MIVILTMFYGLLYIVHHSISFAAGLLGFLHNCLMSATPTSCACPPRCQTSVWFMHHTAVFALLLELVVSLWTVRGTIISCFSYHIKISASLCCIKNCPLYSLCFHPLCPAQNLFTSYFTCLFIIVLL